MCAIGHYSAVQLNVRTRWEQNNNCFHVFNNYVVNKYKFKSGFIIATDFVLIYILPLQLIVLSTKVKQNLLFVTNWNTTVIQFCSNPLVGNGSQSKLCLCTHSCRDFRQFCTVAAARKKYINIPIDRCAVRSIAISMVDDVCCSHRLP